MKKEALRVRIGVMTVLFVLSTTMIFARGESPAPVGPQPFVTLFASSLSRFRSACELIFESVDRRDLYVSMDSRLGRYNDFAGIDREKPLGMMYAWGKESTPFIVFLPVTDIDRLLETVTFGVVGFHQVGNDHYEMGRAQKPYQVLVRKGYALIVESASTIYDMRTTPDQFTRSLRDRYDLAVHFDLGQIPLADKRQKLNVLRAVVEPSLQCSETEPAESGRLRKVLGLLMLELVERVALDTKTLTIGIRIAPDDGHLQIDVELEAVPKSPMANVCNQSSLRKSPFSEFLQSDPDIPAVAVIKLTGISDIARQLAGTSEKPATRNSDLDIVMQLVGERLGEFTLMAALNGSDVKTLNDSLSGLLNMASAAGHMERIDESDESFKGVNFHTFIPPTLPEVITQWIGSAPTMAFGEANQTLWCGIGSPGNLLDDLKDAIEFAEETTAESAVVPIAHVQIKGRVLSEVVASNPLIPNMDAVRVREELSRGDDAVSLKIEPSPNGIRLKLDMDAGFVRLIGLDWKRQIEAGAHPR